MNDRERDVHREPEETSVEELLRLAERRQPPPADRERRVRSAVRASWSEVVARRRTHRRWAWLAAAAVLAAAVTLWVRGGPWEPSPVGEVASLQRTAWQTAGAEELPLRIGAVLTAGERIRTEGDGRAALRIGDASVRLDHGTTLRLPGGTRLELERGAVYVDSAPDAGGGLEIVTPLGSVRDVGTQFEVRLDGGEVRVRVREGLVNVSTEARVEEVGAGRQFRLGVGGAGEWAPVDPHGPAWDWAASIAPVPDLAGWKARRFLEWIARERGWTLEFADPSAVRVAGETIIQGSLQGLTLDQLLEAVLPACGLGHRVADGELIVSLAGGPPA